MEHDIASESARPRARSRATPRHSTRDRSGPDAIIHCIEGGFALGVTATEIAANVEELARSGVAYVTLAHLFWRGVATNAPAIPFVPDSLYKLLFPSRGVGLTALGTAAVRRWCASTCSSTSRT